MFGRIARGIELVRRFGVRTCAFRARYAVLRKSGLLKRRFPPFAWHERGLAYWRCDGVPTAPDAYVDLRRGSPARFFFPPGRPPPIAVEWRPDILSEADEIVAGRLRYFSAQPADFADPDGWFRNPFTGQHADPRQHWCDAGDFEPAQGDLKFIWEPARFSWAFTLARAYAAAGDERYPQAFWRLFESWYDANPPQLGPHWQCGQECTFRLFALCFALYAFWDSPESSAERVATLAAAVAVHADRIEKNIEFARSQKNNHAVSEAAGLYTAGTLFPEFLNAEAWRRRGKALLELEGLRQIYPDGSYVQHSMNYHRVMLHDYLWVLRLAELNRDRFDDALLHRLDLAASFLYQVQDESSGRVPNYGPNDGALVLPLSGCDYPDYRPVLQAMNAQLHRARLFEPGPWDEPLVWLFGDAAASMPVRAVARAGGHWPDGGYDTLRGRESWAMIRCHTYRDRPAQADMLHLDLWWRGENILRDAGTYSYNCPPPWDRCFKSTAAHNTVEVDGLDQMTKGPRFLWFDWIESRRLGREHDPANDAETWTGEHLGYLKRCGVTHRRTVRRLGDDRWEITDDLLGSGTHRAALAWHFIDAPWELDADRGLLRINSPAGVVRLAVTATPHGTTQFRVRRAEQDDERAFGWESLYYGVKTPRPVLSATVTAACPIQLVTRIDLGGSQSP